MSLPARGAWIEIAKIPLPQITKRRSPQGERGLKSYMRKIMDTWNESLPARGAWIEICVWEL